MTPQHGTYMPWAGGPRICPGQKFAQVEFVSVLFTLLANHRIEAIGEDGGSAESMRRKVMEMVDNSAITAITLQMSDPGQVRLRWVEI